MSYHADIAPRRRPWLIATPLILLLVLAAVWCGVWFYARGEAETRINEWQAQQAKAGRVFTCGRERLLRTARFVVAMVLSLSTPPQRGHVESRSALPRELS